MHWRGKLLSSNRRAVVAAPVAHIVGVVVWLGKRPIVNLGDVMRGRGDKALCSLMGLELLMIRNIWVQCRGR